MFAPEDAYVLEAILANRPAHLRWVFIEGSMFIQQFEKDDADMVRSMRWHDWQRTRLVSIALLSSKKGGIRWKRWLLPQADERERLGQVLTHWRLFCMRGLNLGKSGRLLAEWSDERIVPQQGILGRWGDGFHSSPNERRVTGVEREEFVKALGHRQLDSPRSATLGPAPQQSLGLMIANVRKAGAEPILIVAPTLDPPRLEDASRLDAPLLDFSDVARWKELFDVQDRIDMDHLTLHGAELFTDALAQQFLDAARRRTAPSLNR
jgi:hypothetical protein